MRIEKAPTKIDDCDYGFIMTFGFLH